MVPGLLVCVVDPEPELPQALTPATKTQHAMTRRPVQRLRRGKINNTMQATATPPYRIPRRCGAVGSSNEALEGAVVVMVTAADAVPELESFTLAGLRLQAGIFCAFAGEPVSAQVRFKVPA